MNFSVCLGAEVRKAPKASPPAASTSMTTGPSSPDTFLYTLERLKPSVAVEKRRDQSSPTTAAAGRRAAIRSRSPSRSMAESPIWGKKEHWLDST